MSSRFLRGRPESPLPRCGSDYDNDRAGRKTRSAMALAVAERIASIYTGFYCSGAPEPDPDKEVPLTAILPIRVESDEEYSYIVVESLIIAGWTGRDVAAVEEHIRELEKLGVTRPGSVPAFYAVSAANMTTAPRLEALGTESSGEVEFVLIGTADGMLIGVGSDHTDRKLETMSVSLAKQICAKPVSPAMWRYETVADHFDQLRLRSWITEDGERVPYQEGNVTTMRPPEELISLCLEDAKTLPDGVAMYCGTLAAIGEIRPADRFEMELYDPVLQRSIVHEYEIEPLPIVL